ncbi:hypothetical protein SAGO17_0002 [Mimivirus AB-566-O17]|uniref:Uncharacterized protein n=1 Tax=Mimivirus AB-566-O17 TaxID=1988039 RepID=A0A1X9VNK6_9VIRU|nr:hypothetical protein SAGO17_0002 [Mimivirus AB-566-O17]
MSSILCTSHQTESSVDLLLIQHSLKLLLQDHTVHWLTTPQITAPNQYDVIIVYGNTNCLDYLEEYTGSVYFINSNLTGYLEPFDAGDFFFVNTIDYPIFRDRYNLDNVMSISDITFTNTFTNTLTNTSQMVETIGVCLPYEWTNITNSFERIIDNIVGTLVELSKNFNLVYIPFTNQDKKLVYELSKRTTSISSKLELVQDIPNETEIHNLFQKCDYIISSHTTGISLSIMHSKPFLCMYTKNSHLEKLAGEYSEEEKTEALNTLNHKLDKEKQELENEHGVEGNLDESQATHKITQEIQEEYEKEETLNLDQIQQELQKTLVEQTLSELTQLDSQIKDLSDSLDDNLGENTKRVLNEQKCSLTLKRQELAKKLESQPTQHFINGEYSTSANDQFMNN